MSASSDAVEQADRGHHAAWLAILHREGQSLLRLLPGGPDHRGLPDSSEFWKDKLEEADHEKTFAVGLLHGPSGCGKSSLVKAGLLPRLAESVRPIYLEATPTDTEPQLLAKLRSQPSP